jgi:hypothetical protein
MLLVMHILWEFNWSYFVGQLPGGGGGGGKKTMYMYLYLYPFQIKELNMILWMLETMVQNLFLKEKFQRVQMFAFPVFKWIW